MFFTDATYQKVHKSADTEVNKLSFYSPYNRHIVKLMTVCTILPKVKMTLKELYTLGTTLSKMMNWTPLA